MPASVQCRQQENNFAVMKEKEDDLALFLEMRNIEDDRENNFLLQNSEGFNDLLGSEPDNSSIRKMESTMASEEPISNVLNFEDKSDFEWLLTSPDIPLFPSSEMESQKTVVDQIPASNGHSTAPKPKLANPRVEPTSKTKSTSKRSTSTTCTTRKPSPNVSRSSTPTPRPILPSTTKPTRSSTPTSRSTATIKRSSTPTKPTPRSSTPNTRSSTLTAASKSTSRSSTPIRKPVPTVKNPVPSRGTSPTGKPRPLKDDGPSNVRSSTLTSGRQRQQSSSPLRAQNGNTAYDNMRSMIAKSRGRADCSDDVSPVLMGTQMVERVVNMRKLAPPKKDDYLSNHNNNSSRKSSSQESSGFGRSLSKKSFDMALRHMDIRRSVPGDIRSLMTNVPASSVYSVRSGPTKSTTISVSDSPLASSSTASSEFKNDFGSET